MILFLKNLVFTLLMPGSVGVWIPLWIAGGAAALARPWDATQYLALLPLLAGAAIYFWCLWHFAVYGRATPAPIDAPRVLVVRGLYRHVRNPMYVGVLTVIVGWCIVFGLRALWTYAAAVAVGFHVFVLIVEEPTLRRQFGAEYVRYCAHVRRWIPGPRYGG